MDKDDFIKLYPGRKVRVKRGLTNGFYNRQTQTTVDIGGIWFNDHAMGHTKGKIVTVEYCGDHFGIPFICIVELGGYLYSSEMVERHFKFGR